MLASNPHYAATVLRLSLGGMYLAHGLLKLMVFTPAGTGQYFASIGLPAFMGPMTLWLEIFAGLLLLAGVYSRWVAAAMIPVLFGAAVLGHGSNGWVFSNQGGGWEYPVFLLLASVSQFFLGDGAFALTSRLPGFNRRSAAQA